MTIPAHPRTAVRIDVRGLVQGVGFRPFVHRLAERHGLAGWVRNGGGQVEIAVEGSSEEIESFLQDLRETAPPLARVERVEIQAAQLTGADRFVVRISEDRPDSRQPVPPDVAVCAACLAELFDHSNRRYRYPFITCTDCGPRYTVIEDMPYDRERTSMRWFAQCPTCLREYTTAGDRRYHAETNCCAECGPQLWLQLGESEAPAERGDAALRRAAKLLDQGWIVAIRGVGGFHLAVDAENEDAVARLRQLKQREAKPFAVMVRTVDDAKVLAKVSPEEAALLAAPERAIVLLEARLTDRLAPSVAPELNTIGVMLAYTPLHHLLLDLVRRPLVMTSGNRGEEPILADNAEALTRLGNVADAFLLHDREIVQRCDDSVLQEVDGPRFIRRARGFAPLSLSLPLASPLPLLALGAHLKNTFTLVHDNQAWVSAHVGDLENVETLEHLDQALAAYRRLFRIEPQVAVRDLHPGYLSSRLAEESELPTIEVQHHHAHVAAVMAEHGITSPVIGVSYDGTGLGDDGNVWGAEILVADLAGYRRIGHQVYAPLPGGDLAARTPWRAALGYLSLDPSAAPAFVRAFHGISPLERSVAERQIAGRLNCPLASSMGRLFDAAAAVLGVRRVAQYEGQAAMALASLAGKRPAREFRVGIAHNHGQWVMDPLSLLVELGERCLSGADVADLAADFHASIAWVTALIVQRASDETGLRTVALSGGVFQNARLLFSVRRQLVDQGFRVLVPQRLSVNDSAISYGQAAVAAARLGMSAG